MNGIKGTILLSEAEGMNSFLSGTRQAIDDYYQALPELLGRDIGITYKESPSETMPFNRMIVKVKKEIISYGHDEIHPLKVTAPRLEPQELKRWYDEGRDFILLDTRNDYEIRLGTFKDAIDLNISNFRSFHEALDSVDPALKDKPVVTICTGGIRCEKAAPALLQKNFKEVYQLEGGILKYFEECGSAHYDGECFVFDHRVAVDAQLNETQTAQCFACREPLTVEEQRSELYEIGKHCPYCFHLKNKPSETQNTNA